MAQTGAGAAGRRLGRYHLAEPLGGGPTGEVFRAKVYGVAGFERQFAVKRFHPGLVADPEVAAQLAAATRMYGSLEHPRIARLHEYGVTGGDTFTATELVEGLDLARLLAATFGEGEPIVAGAVAGLVSQVARAVGYAHGRGIWHLGICPTNLICTPQGEAKVTDFGVLPPRLPARPASDPTLAARIPYLAPEQLVGEPTGSATDVFQLGVIAYELFTGERCFAGSSGFEVGQKILSSQPQPPPLPKPLVKVIMRCLARSPFERYPDAGALADALDAAVRSTPLAGAKRDVAGAARRALERVATMHESGASGALSFPLPSPPMARAPADAQAEPGAPPSRERPSGDIPTVPRKTMMGVAAKPFQIPTIKPVPPLPSRGATQRDEEAPTQIRDRNDRALTPIGSARKALEGDDISQPEIELSMSDLELPPSNTPAPPLPNTPAPIPAPAPPPRPATEPGRAVTATGSVAAGPGHDRVPQTISDVEPPAPPPAALPEALPMPLPPPIEAQPAPPVRRARGGRRLLIAALSLVVLGGVAAGGWVIYQRSSSAESSGTGGAVADSRPAGNDTSSAKPAAGAKSHAPPTPVAFDAGAAAVVAAPTDAAAAVAAASTDATADLSGDETTDSAEPGKMRIESTPAGAVIYVDGTRKGKTPLTVNGISDTVSLALILPGYELYTTDTAGAGEHRVTLKPVTPPEGPAGIKVRCHKKNRYYVIVDGHDIGQLCPTERIGVDLGEHDVEIFDPETEQKRAFHINVKQTRNSHRVYVD